MAKVTDTKRLADDLLARHKDAVTLWESGRYEGAFLMALVAVAARARHEFPEARGDREAFESYIRSRFQPRIAIEFRGKPEPLETVFYKWTRCAIVHEGGLPEDLRFMDEHELLQVRAGGPPENVLLVSIGWLDALLDWAIA